MFSINFCYCISGRSFCNMFRSDNCAIDVKRNLRQSIISFITTYYSRSIRAKYDFFLLKIRRKKRDFGFYGSFSNSKFTGDISKWNVSNVINMANMFRFNNNFTGDISRWNVSRMCDTSRMFDDSKLMKLNKLPKWYKN